MPTQLETILINHSSTRSYLDQPVPPEVLERIVAAGWRSPTSSNGQHISLIVVQDPEPRARISDIAGGQPWIAKAPVFIVVVIDYHKTALAAARAGVEQIQLSCIDATMVGALDAGITLGRLMAAAQSEGLGIVPIGGIRNDPQAMIDLLQLPAQTFPVVGMALGYPAQVATLKPRLPLPTFRHDERYQSAAVAEGIPGYDRTLLDYLQKSGQTQVTPWTQGIAQRYTRVSYPQVKPVLHKQGFKAD